MSTPVEQLKALKELLDKGSISVAEYEALKQKIIGIDTNYSEPPVTPEPVTPIQPGTKQVLPLSKNKILLIVGILFVIIVSFIFLNRDADGDGIGNLSDSCPDISGLAHCSGCPDNDNDSIGDHEDQCPDQPGLQINKGCPDTDQDGVMDNVDHCPAIAGSGPNGCMTIDASQTIDDRIIEIRKWFKDAEEGLDKHPIGRSESFMEKDENSDYLQHLVSYELNSLDKVYFVKKQGANGYEETIKYYYRNNYLYFIYGKGTDNSERFEYRMYFTREGLPLKVQINKGSHFIEKLPKETYFDFPTCKNLIDNYIRTLNRIENALN